MANEPLSDSTFDRERDLFERAIDLPETEREQFVQRNCGPDLLLSQRISALLLAHQGDKFLPRINSQAPETRERSPATIGELIDRYKLVRVLGEGGCGIVYIAEQEEPVRRQVALKVIKAGMDTKSVIARFEAERQALAMMDHSNIAKVFDAGSTEAGRPYFVMELVKGLKITGYCVQHNLSVRERLNLFLQVCDAVQHAHQKGIIHRDLKPSNILVASQDGTAGPKVIDFGIAKAIEGKLTDDTIHTALHQFIGTPAYMSPEQADLSPDIDTRTDIYSLGVLLYELLTGRPPFDNHELLTAGLDEMRRIIREVEPLRPGQFIKSQIANQKSQIDPDLDWIVLKCLEKDRNRRYETANGVAADIERYLNTEPVVARPPSAAYRFRKMARRNKAAFAAAAAVFLALAAGAVVSTWQAVKAKRAEQTAKQQTEMARSVKDFILDQVLGRVHPFAEPEFDTNKRALVDRISRAVEGAFTNQPLIEAEVRYALGEAFDALDQWDKSREQQEKVVAIRKRLLPPGHSDTILAEAKLAVAYRYFGRRDESEALLAEGIAAARSSLQPLSLGAAEALGVRGFYLIRDGRPGEALPDLREALEILQHTASADQMKVTDVLWTIAAATSDLGRTDEAERLLEDGRQRSEKLHGTNHPWTGFFLKSQGVLFMKQGRLEEAVPKLEQARSIHARTMGPDSALTLNDMEFLAPAYERQGRTNEAAESYADLARGWSTHFPYYRSRSTCSEVAAWFVRHGRLEQAKTIFAQIRASYEANPPKSEEEFNALITATAASNGWPAAARLCRENLDGFGSSLNVWLIKAWIFRYVGEEESYQRVVRTVLALAPSVTSTNDQRVPIEIAALGSFPFSAEQLKQLDLMMDALEAALPGGSTNQQVWGYRALGQMQLQLGRLDKCLEALGRSALHHSSPDPCALFIKALCLHRLGRSDEARAAFEKGEAIMKPLRTESLNQFEGFLPTWQIYQHLLMHRETEAVLGSIEPKP